MTRPLVGITALFVFAVGTALAAAQSASLREELLKKAREIYGDAAPTKLSFITVGKSDLTNAASSEKKGRGGASAKPMESSAERRTVQSRATRVGESGTGVVLESKGDQVYLDANPCNGRIMVFTDPYDKETAGSATCGGKAVPQFKFVQK
jgi:hypothetical protein